MEMDNMFYFLNKFKVLFHTKDIDNTILLFELKLYGEKLAI